MVEPQLRLATISARMASTVAVPRLGRPTGPPRQRRPGCFDGVERVGLALATAGRAIGPVHLDHVDLRRPQCPCEPDAVGAGAFHADTSHGAERAQPAHQASMAGGVGGELLDAQQPADVVQCGGDVHVEVRVHAAGDGARHFYDGHVIPSSQVVKGWHGFHQAQVPIRSLAPTNGGGLDVHQPCFYGSYGAGGQMILPLHFLARSGASRTVQVRRLNRPRGRPLNGRQLSSRV